MGFAVHGDVQLLHAFEQCRLGLAGGAVDLVGQKQVRHYRTGLVDEGAAVLIVDRVADDVGGYRIGGELDTPGLQTQHLCKSHGGGGLAHAGHILHQHMSASQHRHEDLLHILPFADDDGFDFL